MTRIFILSIKKELKRKGGVTHQHSGDLAINIEILSILKELVVTHQHSGDLAIIINDFLTIRFKS